MRIRFLPIAIFATVLMLGFKAGNLLFGVGGAGVSQLHAQEAAKTADPAKSKAQKLSERSGAGQKPALSGGIEGKLNGTAGTSAKGTKEPQTGKEQKPGSLPSDPTLFSQAEIDLLQKLAARRAELERWTKDLEMREQLLKAMEKRIDQKVVELRTIQGKVKALLKQYDKEQEDRLKSLVKIYESMKPKEAARIFMELDMPVLLDVVERMREVRAAPIIAKLEPARAKRVTRLIAARRKFRNGPSQPLPSSAPPEEAEQAPSN